MDNYVLDEKISLENAHKIHYLLNKHSGKIDTLIVDLELAYKKWPMLTQTHLVRDQVSYTYRLEECPLADGYHASINTDNPSKYSFCIYKNQNGQRRIRVEENI